MSNFIVPPSIFTDGVDVSGTGFLAGEFPGGRTTINGVPASASVKAFYVLESGDWQLAGQATSNPDGTWLIGGINHDLRFNVVGQLDGYNDVVMANIKPMRTDIVTYDGAYLQPNESFEGMEGYILLLDGLPPFTVSGTQSMPAGLFTVVDGRKLIIDGTTSEGGEWEAEITIQDANSNTVNIPFVIPIGLDAPSDLAAIYDEVENEITLNWVSNSHVEQAFYIYRSGSPLDLGDLPPPIGSVGKGVTEFVDGTVVHEEVYYYAVAAVWGSSVRVSDSLHTTAKAGDPHWDNVVGLYRAIEGQIVDVSKFGGVFTLNSGLNIDSSEATPDGLPAFKLSANRTAVVTTEELGTDDFTIEMWVKAKSAHGNWPRIWATRNVASLAGGFHSSQYNGNGLEIISYAGGVRAGQGPAPIGAFHHVALVRQSGVYRYYANGVDGTGVPRASQNDTNGVFVFGQGGASQVDFWFSGVRITKGVARYTEDFTPPTEPFLDF